jgi:hypothetical protein
MSSISRRSLTLGAGAAATILLSIPAKARKRGRPAGDAPEIWHRTELYFGTSRKALPPVTDDEFMLFVDQEVTPRFPDGLTLLSGYGQFLNSENVLVKEKSMLLILFYPEDIPEANASADAIREAYKAKFNQESVLRTDSSMALSF